MKQKELYTAPETEVLELRLEGNVLMVLSKETPYEESDDWD